MHMVRQIVPPAAPRVVIVGAGISGLALAILLREANAEVTVLEQVLPPGRKREFPGIVSGSDLRTLGLSPEQLEARLATRVSHLDGAGASQGPDRFPSSWWAVDHGVLLDALRAALEPSGTRYLPQTTVTALSRNGDAITGVRTEASQVIPADLVVLADESDPRVAEAAGLRPDWPPTALMHLGKELFPAPAEAVRDRLGDGGHGYRINAFAENASWGSPGHALVVPSGEGIAIIVSMLLEDEMAHARHIREYLDEVEQMPAVREVVGGLAPSAFFTEVVPVGGFDARPRFHADRLLVVSDLVGMTNPLNRDGLSANLTMCVLAAGTIRDAIARRDFGASALAGYSLRLDREVLGHIETERRQNRGRRHQPAWQWVSKPELAGPGRGVTGTAKSATLSAETVWGRLRGFGRRPGVHRHSPGEYDE